MNRTTVFLVVLSGVLFSSTIATADEENMSGLLFNDLGPVDYPGALWHEGDGRLLETVSGGLQCFDMTPEGAVEAGPLLPHSGVIAASPAAPGFAIVTTTPEMTVGIISGDCGGLVGEPVEITIPVEALWNEDPDLDRMSSQAFPGAIPRDATGRVYLPTRYSLLRLDVQQEPPEVLPVFSPSIVEELVDLNEFIAPDRFREGMSWRIHCHDLNCSSLYVPIYPSLGNRSISNRLRLKRFT